VQAPRLPRSSCQQHTAPKPQGCTPSCPQAASSRSIARPVVRPILLSIITALFVFLLLMPSLQVRLDDRSQSALFGVLRDHAEAVRRLQVHLRMERALHNKAPVCGVPCPRACQSHQPAMTIIAHQLQSWLSSRPAGRAQGRRAGLGAPQAPGGRAAGRRRRRRGPRAGAGRRRGRGPRRGADAEPHGAGLTEGRACRRCLVEGRIGQASVCVRDGCGGHGLVQAGACAPNPTARPACSYGAWTGVCGG
jgi:hypothetical protein